MAATTANAPTPADSGAGARLQQAFGRLSSQQKIALMIATAAIIAVVAGTIMWSRNTDYRVLFSNLSEHDGGAIIAAVEQLQVPYKFSDGSGAILVPSDRVHEVRLRLASQGLPKGGAVGFELMENQKFGTSQFAEQINYQRGLEGELSRTIMAIAAVQAARVHLAIPKPSVFVREAQKPTASVLVQLHPGRTLEPAQVAGITHLVASSLPQLTPTNVAIIDQNGTPLSTLRSKLSELGLDPSQVKYVKDVETAVIQRIEDILGPVTGPGNSRVQVAADVDFSQTEQTSENFRPNGTPPDLAIRSQQLSETASVSPSAIGVPGALSNQPPVPATAPLVSGAPPAGGTPTGVATPGQIAAAGVTAPINSVGQPLNTRKDSTINYEIDRTIRHTKSSLGAVKRLSVAVVVNHRTETGRDGKPVTKARSEEEIKQITDLVREAMGFSQERGDTLSIVNSPFTLEAKSEIDVPLWKQPAVWSMAKEIITYLVVAGVLAYLFFGVVKPLLTTMFAGGAGGTGGATGGVGGGDEPEPIVFKDEIDPELNMELASYDHKLEKARQIAKDDPRAVANVIKDWITPNG